MPWTTKDIPNLNGTVAIVTGANAGLGYHAAEGLARNGATVVMACRSPQRGESALARLRAAAPGADAEVMQLDLSSLGSVHRFADQFQNRYDSLDILLNNAGVMFIPERRETADGLELTLGTNLLGHFALTGLLLNTLTSTPSSRVVSVSSFAHARAEIDFDDPMFETRPFDGGAAYAASKLSNILFAYELQRRFEASDVDSIAVATDPGFVRTNWLRHMRTGSTWDRARAAALGAILRVIGQSAEMGSLALLRAATDPGVRGGEYYSSGGRMTRGYPVLAASSAASRDEAAARRLWDMSEALTGVVFTLKSPAAATET